MPLDPFSLGLGAASLGLGAFSASQAGNYKPPGIQLVGRRTLNAYGQESPAQLGLNRAYQPAYLNLGGQNLQQILFGAPAISGQERYWASTGNDPGQGEWRTVDVNNPATPGLLDTVGQAAGRLQGLNETGTSRAQAYIDQLDPELAGLRRQLTRTGTNQLALGGQINPEDAYRITQSVRGNWAGRGLGRSAPAQLGEALQLYGGGEALRNQRIGQAGNIFNQQQDFQRYLMGLGGAPTAAAMGLAGAQEGLAYQKWFDPFNANTTSISNQGSAINAQQSNEASNALAGLAAGGLNLAGSLYRLNQAGNPVGHYATPGDVPYWYSGDPTNFVRG